jgi:DNA-directed RNA polymerase subunit K/omega
MKIGPIDLERIEKTTPNIYEAVIVASRKARVINDENKIEFNTILSSMPSGGIEDEIDEKENPDQMRLSLEFEARPKPHMKALQDLLEGNVEYRFKDDESQEK